MDAERPVQKSKKVVLWSFKTGTWSPDEDAVGWHPFSDLESEYIEEAYQRGNKTVSLYKCTIDLDNNILLDESDVNTKRSVKRDITDAREYMQLRARRYEYPYERVAKSFAGPFPAVNENLVSLWVRMKENTKLLFQHDYSAITKQGAEGILAEGEKLGKQSEAYIAAEKLRECKSEEEAIICATHLYTSTSFIYSHINSTLRNDNKAKVHTLGAFCWLLDLCTFKRMPILPVTSDMVVYRGTTLTEEMIDEYKNAIGSYIRWTPFTSTSKNKQVAECFAGNTLFIIEVKMKSDEMNIINHRDISSVSCVPDEEEILFKSGHRFIIEKVTQDPKSGKYTIHLTADLWLSGCHETETHVRSLEDAPSDSDYEE